MTKIQDMAAGQAQAIDTRYHLAAGVKRQINIELDPVVASELCAERVVLLLRRLMPEHRCLDQSPGCI